MRVEIWVKFGKWPIFVEGEGLVHDYVLPSLINVHDEALIESSIPWIAWSLWDINLEI